MKKIIFIFLLGTLHSLSQTITYENFKSLIPYLQNENWSSAFKESEILLNKAEKDTSEYEAITIYINILSAAGMVTDGKMTYEELEKKVMKFQGQKIIMSAHPIKKENGSGLNFTKLISSNEAFTIASNKKGINILCFEIIYFKEDINISDLQNSTIRCGGILDKIEMNPNKSDIWILRLIVKDAFARKAD